MKTQPVRKWTGCVFLRHRGVRFFKKNTEPLAQHMSYCARRFAITDSNLRLHSLVSADIIKIQASA